MSQTEPQSDRPLEDDPSFRRSRREAFLVLGLWACCFVWTISYCYLNGYLSHEPMPDKQSAGPPVGKLAGDLEQFNRDPDTLTEPLGLGIPDWVFWGVVVPWVLCILFTLFFCAFVFAEDDLGANDFDEPAEAGR